MQILVIGGTRFIGRHFAAAALRNGHELTLFHRRPAGPGLFPEAEHVLGDRNTDLGRLAGRRWDVTVDVSAYEPDQVQHVAEALGPRAGRYAFISTVAVYAGPPSYGFTEDAPLLEVPSADEWDRYGALKVACESAATAAFGDCLVIRPTYVVGPFDYSGRFTYWVLRIARGGEVLAPGPADAWFQIIDARDLAAWTVDLVEGGIVGTYHAAHPFPPATFGQTLDEIARVVAPSGSTFTWVDRSFLVEAGVSRAALPLWSGTAAEGMLPAADPARARTVGLAPRPLAETIRDVYRHESRTPTPVPRPVGLTAEREADLLARWRHS